MMCSKSLHKIMSERLEGIQSAKVFRRIPVILSGPQDLDAFISISNFKTPALVTIMSRSSFVIKALVRCIALLCYCWKLLPTSEVSSGHKQKIIMIMIHTVA